MSPKTNKPVPIGIRASAELAAWIKAQAAKNERSMSNQIVYVLNTLRKQAEGATQ